MLKKIVQEKKEVEYIENEEISEEDNNKRKYLSFLNESEKNVTDFISSCDEFKKNKDNVILSSIKSVLKFRKKGYTIVFMVFALMFFLMSLTINVAIKKMSENSISNILYNNNIDVYSFQHSLGGAMFFTILLGGKQRIK